MRTQEIVEAYGKTHIYMIGMDDNPQPKHIDVIIKNVKHDNIFSGGKRHYEIVKPFLPADAVWIEIKAPINAVLAEYSRLIQEGKVIVSFVSGDPFFFGFASTIRKNLLGVGMKVFPYFNSLQMFAHHEQIPYENMHAVSVTGRPWHELDRALLEYRPLIGVLTDRVHTPRAIAKRMMEYHLDRDYTMWVAEHLGNPKKEKICVQEAHTLGIPLIGICDTNCDPEELDYVIPGNDDAIRAVKLIVSKMADAVIEANQGAAEDGYYEDADVEAAEAEEAVEE